MSNDLLSQDEIDALLQGVDSGTVGIGPPAAPGEVRAYDFARQGRVPRHKLPGLDAINERFMRGFKVGLFDLLRHAVELSVRSVDVVRFDEYIHSLPQPASLNLVQARPLRGNALVVYEPRLVFTMIDSFFGGGGRLPSRMEGREFTPTEIRIIELMLRQTLADLDAAWAPVLGVEWQHQRCETDPRQAGVLDAHEPLVVSRFSVGLDGGGGDLHVALPYRMLEPLREQLETAASGKQRGDSDEAWARDLRAGLQDADLELSLSIAQRQVSLRELSRLRVGDILPIELARTVCLEVEATPMFEGEFGIHNHHNAIKVTRVKFPGATVPHDCNATTTATP